MYSVVLTELGITVFDDGGVERTFPFRDPVREYVAVRDKSARLGGLVDHLASLRRGVAVSDGSLLAILRRASVDSRMMDPDEVDRVQASKQEIIVESGFASNPHDALGKLRDFALGVSSLRVAEASESPDLHVIQAIGALDEVDRLANIQGARLREWYGLHFPELDNVIDSIGGYAQIVAAGRRGSMTAGTFEEAGFPGPKVEMLKLVSSTSKGGDISDANLAIVQSIASQVLAMQELRRGLEAHIEGEMRGIAPNLSAILGPAVGARILARAGSLKRLAGMPASTIQVLGAEKALFRSLKTGSHPPKHGLLFQHAMVHAAPRWQRGKIARAIAAKAVIAARIDVYGQGINETLLEKLNVRVGEIGKKYAKPTERDLARPQPRGRDGGNFRDSPSRRGGGPRDGPPRRGGPGGGRGRGQAGRPGRGGDQKRKKRRRIDRR